MIALAGVNEDHGVLVASGSKEIRSQAPIGLAVGADDGQVLIDLAAAVDAEHLLHLLGQRRALGDLNLRRQEVGLLSLAAHGKSHS